MAGALYGYVDCYANTGNVNNNAQEIFKNIYDFFVFLETQNVVTIRARYNGDSGTGVDFWDGGNPFRTHAFFLVEWRTGATSPANGSYAGTRNEPFYLLVQFYRADQVSPFTGAGGGLPGLFFGSSAGGLSSTAGVGFQMAVGVGGDLNPWNGTLVLGGAAKGTPVWKNPTGGTGRFVFPRSNTSNVVSGTGATPTHGTNQQNLCPGWYRSSGGTPTRYHMFADHDGFSFHPDGAAGANLYGSFYSGVYLPRAGITNNYPYVMLQENGVSSQIPMGTSSLYGDYLGSNSNIQGGLAFPPYGPEVRGMNLARIDEFATGSLIQPNKLFSPSTHDEMPITLGVADYFGGLAGSLLWLREVQNVTNLETSSDQRRIVLGSNATVTNQKLTTPWNNTVTHGANTTRLGTMAALP